MRVGLLLVAGAVIAAPAVAQNTAASSGNATWVGRAVRATQSPVLDGRDDDEAWQRAPVIQGFRQFSPAEDGDPSLPTAVRVAYDDRGFYVFVRALDPHPDSLVARMSRRDVRTNSDMIGIIIDAYYDRRTAVQFAVNPLGVKEDGAVYQDNITDYTWDGVWDAATRVDSAGWTAEFRIPLSQLRFRNAPEHTFGFAVWRDIGRRNERTAWPLYRPSRQAKASQLGTLEGIAGIRRASRLELLPFVTTQNTTEQRGDAWAHPQKLAAGLDFKYGIRENLTLDATVNPDFGQVEADPAVLNLTAFEIRFEERRPFFQEGAGMFRCQPCQGVFYPRRIGRAPQSPLVQAGDPTFTTILGAAKLTGRFANGVTLGVVEAVTDREVGRTGATIEPRTNYFVGRVAKEMRAGRSSLGFLATAVNRSLDDDTDDFLRREAYTAVVEGFHRFADDGYELAAYLGRNHVGGSDSAIARTQRSAVHYWQRPDGEESYDPSRTTMGGGVTSLTLSKISGAFRFSSYYRDASPGMELNDLGIVPLVNDRQIRNSVSWQLLRPTKWFRGSFNLLESENHWTSGGLPAGNLVRLHTSFSLLNSWGWALTGGTNNYGTNYCVACARGGPAVRTSPSRFLQFNLSGDPRLTLVPELEAAVSRGDEGRSHERRAAASIEARLGSAISASLGASASRRVDDQQWIGNYGALLSDTTHFTFARLRQTTVSLTMRAAWTATPTLSLQAYAEPFVSSGSFRDWRELADPRAPRYAARYQPYGGGVDPEGFNVKQFNSNVVLRWEYRAGSTFFLVWQQGRQQDDLNRGTFEIARDSRDLFRAHPVNTVLAKITYWWNP